MKGVVQYDGEPCQEVRSNLLTIQLEQHFMARAFVTMVGDIAEAGFVLAVD